MRLSTLTLATLISSSILFSVGPVSASVSSVSTLTSVTPIVAMTSGTLGSGTLEIAIREEQIPNRNRFKRCRIAARLNRWTWMQFKQCLDGQWPTTPPTIPHDPRAETVPG